MRDDAVLAEPAHLVGLVVLEVALEPLDVAVALERQNVRGDAVEEPAIVADDDGAACEVCNPLLRLFLHSTNLISCLSGDVQAKI